MGADRMGAWSKLSYDCHVGEDMVTAARGYERTVVKAMQEECGNQCTNGAWPPTRKRVVLWSPPR